MFFRYAWRRTDFIINGSTIESIPWAVGKEHQMTTYKVYLAR